MRIIRSFKKINQIKKPLAVALGNFDGVHLGHRRLIQKCAEESRANGWESGICTFEPHPSKIIAPGKKVMLINTPEQKYRLLGGLGIDNLILLRFDEELAATAPEDFVNKYLVSLLRVKKIYVGFNYTFGLKGKGDPRLLEQLGRVYGFEVSVTEPVYIGNDVVSSTLIRHKYAWGDIPGAARLLGYWPCLEGEVVGGDRRGRELGFPTANVAVGEDTLLPQYGVYAATVHTSRDCNPVPENNGLPAVVNIGLRPTFTSAKVTVEAHLLDFTGDLYGKNICLKILKQVRRERCFCDSAALQRQICQDIEDTRAFFSTTGKYKS